MIVDKEKALGNGSKTYDMTVKHWKPTEGSQKSRMVKIRPRKFIFPNAFWIREAGMCLQKPKKILQWFTSEKVRI